MHVESTVIPNSRIDLTFMWRIDRLKCRSTINQNYEADQRSEILFQASVENFPNNSECNEQSNLSFKVNSGRKRIFASKA
ncbi:hypothetical protein TNCT_739161 [Trichonephila clavata]|uniref:Uncharacterized protein n=1 Tax=Trichonephila clavata TaxID=2740835 RepID=A0A8X6G009_TRICU|nr:hypothetical protein TNCT_739161 [Trichonephila clavata]